MSVLIKDMEMPKNCYECRFAFDGMCIANRGRKDVGITNSCPLIEVPPHGRLIDADTLKARVQKLQEWLWDKLTDANVRIVTADDVRYRIAEEFEDFIDDAPTIISAEEVET